MSHHLARVQTLVANWAEEKNIIRRAFFFGSRVKMTYQPKSDLDIAIQLVFEEPDTALAHWMAVEQDWTTELTLLVPWQVDLEFLHPQATSTIVNGLRDASLLVFERVPRAQLDASAISKRG